MSLSPQDRSSMPSAIALRIRDHLIAFAKTPRRLSLEAGLSPDTVAMILKGRQPTPKTLERLTRILGGGHHIATDGPDG